MRRAPGPPLLIGAGAIALAFGSDHPLVIAAVAAGAVLLMAAAPARVSRLFVLGGLVSGLSLAALNPFVAAEGDLILLQGPALPLLDTEVTLEELVAGAVIGLRLMAVAMLTGAVLAHIDPDRLTALAARLTPRSALVLALSARLLPTLERDARAIAETARLRGVALTDGYWPARARRAAPLAVPLVGSSLERGLDVAEAMAARGYGSGPRSRLPEPRWNAAERAAAALGLALVALALAAIAGAGGYAFYPRLEGVWRGDGPPVAGAALAALGGSAWALARR